VARTEHHSIGLPVKILRASLLASGLLLPVALPQVAEAAAYTFVGSGTPDYDLNASNALTPTAHGSCANGNLMLLPTTQRITGQTVSAITGWTKLGSDNADSHSFELWAKIKSGTNDAPTVQWSGTTADVVAWIDCFGGDEYTDLATIVDTSDFAGNAANEVINLRVPALTINATDALLYIFGTKQKSTTSDPGATTVTAPATTTKTVQVMQTGNSALYAAAAYRIQTTADDYGGDDFTTNATSENTQSTGFAIALKSDAGATPPTFDSGPTVTTVDGDTYQIAFNADANAANIFAVVKYRDSATCTCDDIEANICVGEINYATAATTGSDQTLNINVTAPASDPLPLNDLDICLEGAGGDSSVVEQDDELLDPPAGYLYIQKSGSPSEGQRGLFDNASPAISDDDTMQVPACTDSFLQGPAAHPLTTAADSTFVVNLNLECDGVTVAVPENSRQIAKRRFADYSVPEWSDPAPVDAAINNGAPEDTGNFDDPHLFEKGTALTPVDLEPLASDPEGDAMTVTALDALPAGLSISSNELTGTPTTYGYTTSTLQYEDAYGDVTTIEAELIIGLILPDPTAWLRDESMWETHSLFASEDSFFDQAMGYGR
jgi:hypothetical protein